MHQNTLHMYNFGSRPEKIAVLGHDHMFSTQTCIVTCHSSLWQSAFVCISSVYKLPLLILSVLFAAVAFGHVLADCCRFWYVVLSCIQAMQL